MYSENTKRIVTRLFMYFFMEYWSKNGRTHVCSILANVKVMIVLLVQLSLFLKIKRGFESIA